MKAIVTVVGKDAVGIIAGVCVELANYNVNVLDISQTVMQGYFTMMMVVDVSGSNLPVVELAQKLVLRQELVKHVVAEVVFNKLQEQFLDSLHKLSLALIVTVKVLLFQILALSVKDKGVRMLRKN